MCVLNYSVWRLSDRFWAFPAFLLKRQILVNLPSDNLEQEVANSIDFMVERVSHLCCVCVCG